MDPRQDLRYALRSLRKSPGFTLAAVLTLALGIGANTAMFSVIRAVFLRPLPVANEERLIMLWQSNPEKGIAKQLVSPANFVDWAAQNSVLEEAGAWPGTADSVSAFNLVGKDGTERVRGAYVSSGFFRALGVPPLLGRTFLPEEDQLKEQRSAVLSHSYWRARFGADPGVLGKTLEVDTFRGGVYTIVGVMPAAFDFPRGARIWLPMAYWGGGPLPPPDAAGRCCPWFNVVARLRPGVTLERAGSELTTIARRVSERHPNATSVTEVRVVPLREEIAGGHRTGLYALFAAVGCVLWIACANVANLLLSRAVTRRTEMGIRAALGATPARLARQILAESLLLSGLGAAAGAMLAVWAQDLLAKALSGGIPLAGDARIDVGVLAFMIATTLATGCICGLAPVTQLTPGSLGSLGGGSRSQTAARSSGRLRQALVAGQVALAVALVAGAGLFIRSLAELERVDPGFRPERVLAVSFDFTAGPFRGPGNQQPYFHQLMTRVAGLPGVRMVGGINEPPLAGSRMPNQPISREGQPLRTAAESPQVIQQAVTPDYFRVMGIPLRKGRFFTEADAGEGRFPAIVNETAARLYWPGQDPLGKRFAMGSLERLGYFRARGNEPEWREIVGVVADVRSSGLDVPAQPEVFYSYRQFPWYGATLVARAEGDAARLAAAIRRETLALHRRAVITEVRTMRQIAADSVAQPRFRARLVGLFSALALLLGMLGIYGVTSYTVAQRTHEIGIRMALGATAGRVSRMVFGQSMRVTAIGLALGIACALIAARWISSLLYGVTPWDPVALAAACLALAGATLGASYLPARRAARVDPAVALRAE